MPFWGYHLGEAEAGLSSPPPPQSHMGVSSRMFSRWPNYILGGQKGVLGWPNCSKRQFFPCNAIDITLKLIVVWREPNHDFIALGGAMPPGSAYAISADMRRGGLSHIASVPPPRRWDREVDTGDSRYGCGGDQVTGGWNAWFEALKVSEQLACHRLVCSPWAIDLLVCFLKGLSHLVQSCLLHRSCIAKDSACSTGHVGHFFPKIVA